MPRSDEFFSLGVILIECLGKGIIPIQETHKQYNNKYTYEHQDNKDKILNILKKEKEKEKERKINKGTNKQQIYIQLEQYIKGKHIKIEQRI